MKIYIINTIYLKETSWTPKEPFFAIKFENALYPCSYQSDAKKGKFEAFIRGVGHKKAKKGIEIPLLEQNPSIEQLNDYINKYGANCAFYSITGFTIDSNDCVVSAMQTEFKSGLAVGLEYTSKFAGEIHQLNQMIKEVYQTKYGIDFSDSWNTPSKNPKIYGHFFTTDLFYVRPNFALFFYWLCAPHIDPVNDDSKMEKLFTKLYDSEKTEFPVSVKDRLTFLFGEPVCKEYERLMDAYKLTYNP